MSLLFNSLRFQISATIIYAVLFGAYCFRPKLNILSTKVFNILLGICGVYLIFDYATVFSLIYFDSFPEWLRSFFHQGFIICIYLIMIFIFAYLDSITHKQRRLPKIKMTVVYVTMTIGVLMLFAPIKYHHSVEEGFYSYGPRIIGVYVMLTIYSLIIIITAIRSLFKYDEKKYCKYILCTMAVWCLFGIIQMIVPKILISSLAVSIMLLLTFLSIENPAEYIDSETNTFNAFAMKRMLQDYMSDKKNFAVVNIDMEELAVIKRHYDEEVSDELFIMVKEYFEKEFNRKGYRFEEDALTFLMTGKDLENIDFYLEDIKERMSWKWEVNGNAISISSHIDFIRCPQDFPFDGKLQDLLEFIKNCHLYSEEKSYVHRVNEKLIQNRQREKAILTLLEQAIKNDEIEMYYQPIYSIQEGKYTNVEALVRLTNTGDIGYVSPEEFIPLAERNSKIAELSERIFNRVFKFMSENKIANKGVRHMETNLSALQSVNADLPDMFVRLFRKYEIDPQNVNLEITESLAISSGIMLRKNMDQLRSIGCSFSMDDFGTGYSNLSQMVKANFELIKIDKSLLWPAFDEKNKDRENALILLTNMIEMIKKMKYKIVVEGVETQEQFDFLKKMNVDFIQGYYLSRPIPEKEYLKFLEEKN